MNAGTMTRHPWNTPWTAIYFVNQIVKGKHAALMGVGMSVAAARATRPAKMAPAYASPIAKGKAAARLVVAAHVAHVRVTKTVSMAPVSARVIAVGVTVAVVT